jgi:hypothetical protein
MISHRVVALCDVTRLRVFLARRSKAGWREGGAPRLANKNLFGEYDRLRVTRIGRCEGSEWGH